MGTDFSLPRMKSILCTVLIGLATLFHVALIYAQGVGLNPGFITGQIRIGNAILNSLNISASAPGGLSASQSLAPNATSATYNLTVQVPDGSPITYNVQACTVFTDSNRDRICFPVKPVVVNEGLPAAVQDFVIDNPGFIQGTISVTGGTLVSVTVNGSPPNSTFASAHTSFSTGGTSTIYQFPVDPASGIRCTGSVIVNNGVNNATVSLSQQIVDVTPGGTATCNYSVTAPPPAAGNLAGAVELQGSNVVDRYDVGASGASTLFLNRNASWTNNLTNYGFTLPTGTRPMSATARLNNGDDVFTLATSAFDPTRNPIISEGSTTTVNVSACQAFINGRLTLSGTAGLPDLSFGQVFASGLSPSAATGGSSNDRLNLSTGDLDLIVSPGDWRASQLSLNFFRPVTHALGFLNQSFSFSEATAFSTTINAICGGTASKDFNLAMGSVTIGFAAPPGTVFSNPNLSYSCTARNQSNQILYSYSGNSGSTGQNNVSEGRVTFIGPAADCTVTPRATIGGSSVNLGQIPLTMIPGVGQVFDVGGPAIFVTYPEAELIINDTQVTVAGTATDGVQVANVAVNGVQAAVASSNNPADANEVMFEATILLPVKGPNEITSVVANPFGKTATDTRTVYRDSGQPTLSWTPADGTVTTQANASIAGTAADDAGIKSITIDGTPVPFTPTGNPNNEVSFSASAVLILGSNAIEVVATDISNRITVQVHEITLVDNRPPLADAGGPYTINEGASVVLNGGGSDPDGDTINFAWDLDNNASFETSGQTPTFSAAGRDGLSNQTIMLRVCDTHGSCSTASTTVTINNVPPAVGSITAPVDPVALNTTVNASASFTDAGTPDTHTAQWIWGDGSSSTGAVIQGSGSGSVAGSRGYTSPGIYTVKLTVTDDDSGKSESEFKYVVVYDPNGSFVTGGGWINSPAGAYVADPSLSGKANFGFVSKYEKGAKVPSGKTEFQFHAGNLNFHSSTYEWLVVSGARAQFKGSGTINGAGSYGFLLTAIDGQVSGGGGADKFRIKIWDKNNGDVVVYNNEIASADDSDPTTLLAGGSIVIHTGGKK